MIDKTKDNLLEIFNYFGYKEQRNKLCEEFRELQDELFYIYELGNDRENLLNEGIDTISLILQFLYDYGYTDELIINTLKDRVNRTIKRKNEGYYD